MLVLSVFYLHFVVFSFDYSSSDQGLPPGFPKPPPPTPICASVEASPELRRKRLLFLTSVVCGMVCEFCSNFLVVR